MVTPDTRLATQQDIIRLFRELLGRNPESNATIEAQLGQPVLDLAIYIAKSSEYRDRLFRFGLQELRLLVKAVPGADKLPDDWLVRFNSIAEARPFSNTDVIDYLGFIADPDGSDVWPPVTEPYGEFAFPESVTIVVPTINSSAWISDIYDVYRNAGLDPLFAVDSRSNDDTEGVLKRLGARYVAVASASRRVESLLPAIATSSPTDWVLRIDDDELPSGALLRWLSEADLGSDIGAYAIPNCPLMLDDTKRLLHSRFLAFGPAADFDRHWRLFHRGRVQYTDKLHTPGVEVQNGARAPDDAMLLHFDWILRSYDERLKKYDRYRQQSELGAERVRHFGIWEDIPFSWHCAQAVPSELLTILARQIEGRADGIEAKMLARAKPRSDRDLDLEDMSGREEE